MVHRHSPLRTQCLTHARMMSEMRPGALFMGCLALQVYSVASVSMAETADVEHIEKSAKDTLNGLLTTLSAADIAAPQLVARVLQSVELVPTELEQLDSTERAELVDAMKAADVTLGDRFRVRTRISDRVNSDSIIRTSSSEKMDTFEITPRGLQSDGSNGVSGDSIALMLTALLGVGSFIVQAVTVCREKQVGGSSEPPEHLG